MTPLTEAFKQVYYYITIIFLTFLSLHIVKVFKFTLYFYSMITHKLRQHGDCSSQKEKKSQELICNMFTWKYNL